MLNHPLESTPFINSPGEGRVGNLYRLHLIHELPLSEKQKISHILDKKKHYIEFIKVVSFYTPFSLPTAVDANTHMLYLLFIAKMLTFDRQTTKIREELVVVTDVAKFTYFDK